MRRRVLLLAGLCGVAAGCGDGPAPPPVPTETAPAAVVTPSATALTAPTVAEAAVASYSGIYPSPVTLTDGRYEGTPFEEGGASRPRVDLIDDLMLTGDLDDDGQNETVVLLAGSSGGSGSFTYIAALKRQGSTVVNIGTAPLGDRVQIRKLELESGVIVVDLVQAGPEDAACCPSQLATRRWRLTGGGLEEGPAEVSGNLSTDTLDGVQWRLVGFGLREPMPAEPEITFVVHGDKVSGKSGCNRYVGSLSAGKTPDEISFGPLAGTMMACAVDAMELERRYLTALAEVSQFSFHFGQLMLTSVAEDGHVSLLLFENTRLPDGG